MSPAQSTNGSHRLRNVIGAYNNELAIMEPRPIRLTVLQPNLAPQKIETRGPLITLGRATDCTIPISDKYLSRRHAEIAYDANAWIVRDLGSSNGTLLNGKKIPQPTRLQSGDQITLCNRRLTFHMTEVGAGS